MSVEKVKNYLKKFGLENAVMELGSSSATVELAALALGCEPGRIAKTLSFHTPDGAILIVAAGDVKIDNKKFRERFGVKAKMLQFDEVEPLIGQVVGGVCPFAVKENVGVYLDDSLKNMIMFSLPAEAKTAQLSSPPPNLKNMPTISKVGLIFAKKKTLKDYFLLILCLYFLCRKNEQMW